MSTLLANSFKMAIAAARPGLLESPGLARLRSVKVVAAPRVRLDLALPLERGEPVDAKLHAFMQSGLGAYAVNIQVTPRNIEVELNLAREDIDFAFHTLVSRLSEAIIGPVCARPAPDQGLKRQPS